MFFKSKNFQTLLILSLLMPLDPVFSEQRQGFWKYFEELNESIIQNPNQKDRVFLQEYLNTIPFSQRSESRPSIPDSEPQNEPRDIQYTNENPLFILGTYFIFNKNSEFIASNKGTLELKENEFQDSFYKKSLQMSGLSIVKTNFFTAYYFPPEPHPWNKIYIGFKWILIGFTFLFFLKILWNLGLNPKIKKQKKSVKPPAWRFHYNKKDRIAKKTTIAPSRPLPQNIEPTSPKNLNPSGKNTPKLLVRVSSVEKVG